MIYNLPDDFNSAEEQGKPVIIRTYRANTNSAKNKSIIHQNMVDIIIAGKKTIIDVSNTAALDAGELMILSKGSSLIHQALALEGHFQNLVFYFTNDVFSNFRIKYASHKNELVKNEARHTIITYQQDQFIKSFVDSILLLLRSPAKFSVELKLVKLEELLLYLLQSDSAKFLSLDVNTIDNEDMQIRKVVESHITTPVSVEDLAFLSNSSLSTFKRRFLKLYGTSPQKWLIQQKMQVAANLLKSPGERPGLVYEKVGYENQSGFILAFKSQYGVTPKEYQRRNLDR